jgi:uncharacterized membrane protein (DUF485 family)
MIVPASIHHNPSYRRLTHKRIIRWGISAIVDVLQYVYYTCIYAYFGITPS